MSAGAASLAIAALTSVCPASARQANFDRKEPTERFDRAALGAARER